MVVIRASGADGYQDYFFRELGVTLNSVTTIVFQSREDAADPQVLHYIRNAECIFFAGGDQSKYFEYLEETLAADALQEHIDLGKPLGGTSAGLAILGEKAYAALHSGSLDSTMALQNPFHPNITLCDSFLKIPLLSRILTDTHFMQRGRLGRLMVFLSRIQDPDRAPEWVGLGVDEGTALWVDAQGEGRVYRNGSGQVHLLSIRRMPELSSSGNQLQGGTFQLTTLGPDSCLHLPSLEVKRPDAVSDVHVDRSDLRIESHPPTDKK